MAEPVVTNRQLRATLLERQLLLERSTLAPLAAIERIGGLQTQYAPGGYVTLWSRLDAFPRTWLTRALEERAVIQGTLIRSTIHTVSAADYWPMTTGVRRLRRAWLERAWRRQLDGLDADGLAAATREALADGPLRFPGLLRRLTEQGFPEPAARWAGHFVDLVRVPPSGTWERRSADLYALAECWLPLPNPPPTEPGGLELLVRRALGAYGPMGARDLAGWMGLPIGALQPTLERLDLRPLRAEDGVRLFDLPEARLPDPARLDDASLGPRFLAMWDPVLLIHFRRTEILAEPFRPRLMPTATAHWIHPFLIGGQVAGGWRPVDDRIELTPFRPLASAEQRDLGAEADRLAAFFE